MLQFFLQKERGLAPSMSRGFTLIELLVVIAVIGMLTSVAMVSMGPGRSKARDVRRMSDMRQVVTAEALVMGDNENYATSAAVSFIPAIKNATGTVYLVAIDDPQAPTRHYYWITNAADAQRFCAYATLENGTNIYFVATNRGTFATSAVPTALGPTCGN
jgi:prepilin-type N-terminal cleavage/methylation domain-containing protein